MGKKSDWEKEILGFLVGILSEFQLVFSDLFLGDCQWITGLKKKKILCLGKFVFYDFFKRRRYVDLIYINIMHLTVVLLTHLQNCNHLQE